MHRSAEIGKGWKNFVSRYHSSSHFFSPLHWRSRSPGIHKGAFTNYIDKKRWVVSPKKSTFCQLYQVKNVIGGGWVVKKKLKTCQRSFWTPPNLALRKSMNQSSNKNRTSIWKFSNRSAVQIALNRPFKDYVGGRWSKNTYFCPPSELKMFT